MGDTARKIGPRRLQRQEEPVCGGKQKEEEARR